MKRLRSDASSFSVPDLSEDQEPRQELAPSPAPAPVPLVTRPQPPPVQHNFTMTGIKSKNLYVKEKAISILPNPTGLLSMFQGAPEGASVAVSIHGMDVAENAEAGSTFTGVQGDDGLEKFLASNSRNASAGSTRDPTLCYNLSGKGPGTALIINNRFKKADEDTLTALETAEFEVEEREGSEKDVEVTKKLLEKMGCKVFKADNVKSTDLHQLLENFKAKCKDSAFCIIIMMTHGGNSKLSLLMEDLKEVDLWNQIVYPFSQKNFQSFSGRPKIFLIQACANYNSFEQVAADGVLRQDSGDSRGGSSLPPSGELADVFIGAACLPYRLSYRNTVSGSWYIQSIHEIFARCWRDEDLETMHTKVENSVVSKVKAAQENLGRSDEQVQLQTPYVTKRGFKKFYFSPDEQ